MSGIPFGGESPISISSEAIIEALGEQQNLTLLGYVIVGWIHIQSEAQPSHPGNAASQEGGDWAVHASLQSASYAGFRIADQNLMMYIVDEAGWLYEYSSSDVMNDDLGSIVGVPSCGAG